jgi:putative flippase GtrA
VPRFVVAGTVNTVVTYVLYLALLTLTDYRIAFMSSFVAGIAISYALNARFVFRRPARWSTFLRFPLVYLAQYVVGLMLLALFVEKFGVAEWLAPLAVLAITIPATYLLMRMIFTTGEPR